MDSNQHHSLQIGSFGNAGNQLRPEQLQAVLSDPRVQMERALIDGLVAKHLEEFGRTTGLRETSRARLASLWGQFVSYCLQHGKDSLPAAYTTVLDYLQCRAVTLHRNTLAGDVWAISTFHNAAGLPNPATDSAVTNLLKRIGDQKAANEEFIKQATPLRRHHLETIIKHWGDTESLIQCRDATLIAVSYSGLLRSSEVRNIKLSHLDDLVLTIPVTKTNHSGVPDRTKLTRFAADMLDVYIERAGLRRFGDGFIFTGISNQNRIQRTRRKMASSTLANVYKRAYSLCYPDGNGSEPAFSTHSCRVGGAQDLWNNNVQIETIMKLGRWQKGEIVYRYSRGHVSSDNPFDELMSF